MRSRTGCALPLLLTFLAVLAASRGARAEDSTGGYVASALAIGAFNLAFTAYDLAKLGEGSVPIPVYSIVEIVVMGGETLAIWALAAGSGVSHVDRLPLFAGSIWPAALVVHGVWALVQERPTAPSAARHRPTPAFAVTPRVSAIGNGAAIAMIGRF